MYSISLVHLISRLRTPVNLTLPLVSPSVLVSVCRNLSRPSMPHCVQCKQRDLVRIPLRNIPVSGNWQVVGCNGETGFIDLAEEMFIIAIV